MIPINDVMFNNLDWQELEASELDNILSSCTVTGVEPVGQPFTEGVVLYLMTTKQEAMALQILADMGGYITLHKADIKKI